MTGNLTVPPPLEVLRSILSSAPGRCPRRYAIDVGAHVGEFSRELLASGLFEGVVAFEPNPANAERLAELCLGLEGLTLERSAVGDRPGLRDFHFDADLATGSLLAYRSGYVTDGPVKTVSVPVVTLDEYRASSPLAKGGVALVKVDTQGSDLAVIEGASRTLECDRPLVIAEMIYAPLYEGQASPEEIVLRMKASRYQLYAMFNIHATAEGRIAFLDALFVPGEIELPRSRPFVQIDRHESFLSQIETLDRICRERLDVINVLDAEVRRLSQWAR